MTFTKDPFFWRLVPYMDARPYLREGGGHFNPRDRLECVGMPAELRAEALAYRKPCPACGLPYNPIRERASGGSLYFACSHDLDTNKSCSRTKAAAQEAAIVGQAIRAYHAGRGTKALF